MTADGSMILARSEDWNMSFAKNLEIYEDREEGPKEFVAQDSGFRCELPREALGYTALAPCHAFSGNSQVVVGKTVVFHSLTWDSR